MADSDMDDVTREELQNRLIREISSVLDGNHVRSSDIRIRSCEGAFAHCNASVIWHFGHSVRTESHVGRKEAPRHFGGDRAALEAALTELCEHADQDVELRVPFMTKLVNMEKAQPGSSLTLAGETQSIHVFETLSLKRLCSSCGGSGVTRCNSCGGSGRHTCSVCGGSGHVYTQETVYVLENGRQVPRTESRMRSCSSCGGGGQTVCASCGGSGTQTCSSCHGYGFFTDLFTVVAEASPTWLPHLESPLEEKRVREYLEQSGPVDVQQRLEFTLSRTGYTEDDAWKQDFTSRPAVLQLNFSVKGRDYQALAVGPQAFCFSPPAVLDDLLTEEHARLKALAGAKLVRKADALFEHMRALPALDRTLKALATLEDRSPDALALTMLRVNDRYLSHEAARDMASGLLRLLSGVAPQYSVKAWFPFLFLPAVGAFWHAAANARAAMSIPALLWLGLSTFLGGWLLCWILSPLGWACSTLVTRWKNRRLPEAYRQPGNNRRPLRMARYFALVGTLIGLGCGLAASYGLLPRLPEFHSFISDLLGLTVKLSDIRP